MVNKLLYICLFSLCLGQLGIIYKSGEVRVNIFDLLILAFSLFGLFYLLLIKKKIYIAKAYIFLGLFLIWALITFPNGVLALNSSQTFASFFYLGRFIIYSVSGLVIFNLLKQSVLSFESFLTVLFLSGFLVSIAGFIQLIMLPDFTVFDPSLGLDPHKNRLASTFLDPNFAGGYLGLILAIALSSFYGKFYNWNLEKIVLFIAVPIVALFLTFSRSSWGMFAVVILVFGLFKSRKLLLLSLLLAISAYFAIPRVQTRLSGTTDPADSAAFRLISWKNALEIGSDNLLFGTGFNTYRYAQKDYGFIEAGESGGNSGAGADSSLLLVFATTGILGLLLFPMSIINFLSKYFLLNFKKENTYGFLTLTSILGLLIHSQFVNALFYPPIMLLWPLILSLDEL